MTGTVLAANATCADVVLRAGAIHTLDGAAPFRSVAIRDGRIIALGEHPDDLAFLVGGHTTVVRDPELSLLPAFHDSHNHQVWSARDAGALDLSRAACIGDVVKAVRERAAVVAPGTWIVSGVGWHETNLAEKRLPTSRELDAATDRHPVFLRRGGHVGVANSPAMALGGITRDSGDPAGGTVVRDADGQPAGPLIERPAFRRILELLPVPTADQHLEGLRLVNQRYNRAGIAAIRDPGIHQQDLAVYLAAHRQGMLTVRSNVMLRLDVVLEHEAKLRELASWWVTTGFGDDMLRIGGLKLIVDGGIEGASLCDGYANEPGYRGHLFYSVAELAEVLGAAIDRGWRVGCHAVGDNAVRTVLDAYERVLARRPGLDPGTLTLEHALLAGEEERRRAVGLGVAVTVQHPLVWMLAGNMLSYWGAARTAAASPVSGWLRDGALIAAGSDCDVAPFDPMLSIWGLVTRQTAVAGVQGPRHAVDRQTAFALYTVAGAHLLGEQDRRGTLAVGQLADIVGFRTDPLSCPIDVLPELRPALTLLGGAAVHDPDGLLGDTTVEDQP